MVEVYIYILPGNHWISFATLLVYSDPVIETLVFSEIHGKWELAMDRYFEAEVYSCSLKEYQTFGPENKQTNKKNNLRKYLE